MFLFGRGHSMSEAHGAVAKVAASACLVKYGVHLAHTSLSFHRVISVAFAVSADVAEAEATSHSEGQARNEGADDADDSCL